MKKFQLLLVLFVGGLLFLLSACTAECTTHCSCTGATINTTYSSATKSACEDYADMSGCTCTYDWGD